MTVARHLSAAINTNNFLIELFGQKTFIITMEYFNVKKTLYKLQNL